MKLGQKIAHVLFLSTFAFACLYLVGMLAAAIFLPAAYTLATTSSGIPYALAAFSLVFIGTWMAEAEYFEARPTREESFLRALKHLEPFDQERVKMIYFDLPEDHRGLFKKIVQGALENHRLDAVLKIIEGHRERGEEIGEWRLATILEINVA